MTGRDAYHRIRVSAVVEETADARSLVLAVPDDLAGRFAYRPGQFLTVRVPRGGGGTLARCYSLSSAPELGEPHTITVKRVPGGHASNWLCDQVTAGTHLQVSPPAGRFVPDSLDADLLLLAGGSGITPMASILKSILARGRGRVALVYANRDEDSVIFAAALRDLETRHPDRLWVRHWFDAERGPPTADALATLTRPYADRDTFVCGPEPYLVVARDALTGLGVAAERIHVERFEAMSDDEPPAAAPAAGATVQVTLDGRTLRLPWPAGTRLLDLLIDTGLNPPYSCRQGICGACACRLVDGDVVLLHNEVLEEQDFAEGYTLACQALPLTATVVVDYS
ncbi:ferredoxin--NADP reductase [Micromonospora sp. WMMA1363]|uniref:ferredoxin--NADP reductase n=1 Tax=Micromonospora sp. WMMA1363 TaxID=3053985 RepID=UPI00259D15DB|nr:ferredoxin--NADP reductase [Micromonospora sp. WMMA1363]MDM4719419.1 ferredoxin--NADP reductase [Micromonospora sp. WMMA1363]